MRPSGLSGGISSSVRQDSVADHDLVEAGIQDLYRAMSEDAARNEILLDDIIRAIVEGHSPIVLTERRDHLEYLRERLQSFVRHLVVPHGGMSPKERKALGTRLADVPAEEERLLLATGRYIGEGFDDARLTRSFLPCRSPGRGRWCSTPAGPHRLHPRKSAIAIYDYVDAEVPVLRRMFDRRMRTYRAMGYAQAEDSKGAIAASRERALEYDQNFTGEWEEI